MSKYQVGDKVKIKDYIDPKGVMVDFMLLDHGGKVRTISKVIKGVGWDGQPLVAYELAEGPDGFSTRYVFLDEDIECLVKPAHKTQRIEIPIPGGHLVAETCDWGGTHPGIIISFIKSGETEDQILCFAEVDIENNPDAIRLGTFYEDGRDVKEIFEYPMSTKEEK